MQTKDFPSVIAVKKSTQPLIEQYKNMMDTEQKTNMPQISKEQIEQITYFLRTHQHELVSVEAVEKSKLIDTLQELLDKPEGKPLEYLLDGMRVKLNFNKMGNMTSLSNMEHELQGRWVCFVGAENGKHLKATHPAPFTPIKADDVTDGMIHDWHANTFGTQSMGVTDRDMIAAAVNAYMKEQPLSK